ncbi:MAG: hypothetical protein AAFY84_13120 [Pseudomonadota bacterium]
MSDGYSSGSSGMLWVFLPIIIFLLAGAGLSVAAYAFADPQLTIVESLGAGYGGLGGIVIGLFATVLGLIIGLIGTVIGLVTAGGALAVTLFLVGSPIIAIILLFLLLRRRGA